MKPINNSTSPGILRWEPTAWLRVAGPDAATFLQGQFTNDVRGLVVGHGATYGLWLTLKGKVIADSFMLRGAAPDEFWLGSYYSAASVIRERLESHVIADDVTVEDRTGEWIGLSVIDVPASDLPTPAGVLAFRGRRTRAGNAEWLAPRAMFPAVRALFAGVRELDERTVEARRIKDGVPAVPRDIGPGDLPNEGNLDVEAISYTKGCYLGQEVMARLKSMGQVRRRLVRVRLEDAECPPTPAGLWLGGRTVGELRSVAADPAGAGCIGLAMVSRLHVNADSLLALGVDAAPTVRLLEAP